MILAGGRVDELNVLTQNRPKSAVPFGGFGRIIDFSLSNLMNSQIYQVLILSQYRSFSLINHIGAGAAWDMIGRNRQVLVMPPVQGAGNEGWYRGPADAIYKNLDYVQYNRPEEVLILSGDHIYSMDYQPLLEYHRRKNADITMAFTEVPKDAVERFGIGELDDEDGETGGRVTAFWEKSADARSQWASMTVFCFKPKVLYEVLEVAEKRGAYHFGREIIPALLNSNRRIYGYRFSGYWGYTRTINEYWQSNMDMLGENPKIDLEKWVFRTNLDSRHIRDNAPTLIGEGAAVSNSMVYNGSEIHGTVRNSVIFPGVQVKKGAVVENSVLFFGNIIGENCRLNKVVSDINNRFHRSCTVGTEGNCHGSEVTVVGSGNIIPAETVIGEGGTIHPELTAATWHKNIRAGEVLR